LATKFITGINVRYVFLKNKNITTLQSFILSLFLDIDIRRGIPSNKTLSNILGTSKNSISNNISKLKRLGLLIESTKYSDIEAFNKLKNKDYISGCIFCGISHITLDEHHYPIRAKDGGVNTITICPNCHRHFHELTDYNRVFTLSDEVKNAR